MSKLVFNKLTTVSDTISVSFDGGDTYTDYNVSDIKSNNNTISFDDSECSDLTLIRIKGQFKSVDDITVTKLSDTTDTIFSNVADKDYVKDLIDSSLASYQKVKNTYDSGWFTIEKGSSYEKETGLTSKYYVKGAFLRDVDHTFEISLPVNQYGDANQWNNIIFNTGDVSKLVITTGSSSILHSVQVWKNNESDTVDDMSTGEIRVILEEL